MIIDNMNKKVILISNRSDSDPIQFFQCDSSFYLILIFKINKFFNDGFDNVVSFKHIKYGLVGQY